MNIIECDGFVRLNRNLILKYNTRPTSDPTGATEEGRYGGEVNLRVTSVQDEREEGGAVHHRPLHQLRHGDATPHRQEARTLDREGSGPPVPAG